jgi:hypothetical protein
MDMMYFADRYPYQYNPSEYGGPYKYDYHKADYCRTSCTFEPMGPYNVNVMGQYYDYDKLSPVSAAMGPYARPLGHPGSGKTGRAKGRPFFKIV